VCAAILDKWEVPQQEEEEEGLLGMVFMKESHFTG